MMRVSLVWSVHQETGVATAGELHWLLQRMRPEVLFLEHSAGDFAAFLDGSCGTLESAAVRRYRTLHPVDLVPVDLPPPDAESRHKSDSLFDAVEALSSDYCRLFTLNSLRTGAGGFAYLNSESCIVLQDAMQRAMRAAVENRAEPSLTELYSFWMQTNDLREEAMLDGVEAFARHTPFAKAVLLVGAAHIHSLFNKTQARQAAGSSPVLWDFDWRLEIPYGANDT